MGAIKLLQLSNIELAEFIDKAQLENPFLQEKKEISKNQIDNDKNFNSNICENLQSSIDPLKQESRVDLENTFDTHLSSDSKMEKKKKKKKKKSTCVDTTA